MCAISKRRIVSIVLAIICLGMAQIACGLFTSQGNELIDPSVDQPSGNGGESEGPSDSPDPGEGSGSMDEQSEAIVEPEFGSDTLPCPPKGTLLILGFDHALTINYGETSINHFLHQGWLNLEIVDDNGTIQQVGTNSIDYSMEGMMSEECTLTSQGLMIPSAHGSCEAGVVSLFIEENWQPLEGEMVCIDPDGDVDIVPFNTPAMGVQKHSGPNGTGEIFYLVAGSEGYSTMRPFLEGDGYHTWTLYMDEPDMPLEPLVP